MATVGGSRSLMAVLTPVTNSASLAGAANACLVLGVEQGGGSIRKKGNGVAEGVAGMSSKAVLTPVSNSANLAGAAKAC